jgi:peroxiredoxin
LAEVSAKLDSFISKGCRVSVVTAGTIKGAGIWREKHNVTLPIYVNESRALYASLRLGRRCSILNLQNIDMYAKQIINNEQLLTDYEGDDFFIVAGDFIFSPDGKIVYAYATKDVERPSIDELLNAID